MAAQRGDSADVSFTSLLYFFVRNIDFQGEGDTERKSSTSNGSLSK